MAPEELAAAHEMDLRVQDKYGVRYLTYWFDRANGGIFCLADAPSAEVAVAVHREAHGLEPEEIIPVEQGGVEGFLGRTADPPGQTPGQPIFDSAFRIIVFTDIEGSTRLTQRLGDKGAMELLHDHNEIVRGALREHGGSEVKHTGDGIMASFVSVTSALESTIVIQRTLLEHNSAREGDQVRVRLGLSAGEPVEDSGDLFGAVVQLARRICDAAEPGSILTSNAIRELAMGKMFRFTDRGEKPLKGFDDPVRLHELHWQPE
jgi:hypothetical protein